MVCTICNSVISVIFKAFCTKLLEWFKNRFIAVVDKFHCAACFFLYLFFYIIFYFTFVQLLLLFFGVLLLCFAFVQEQNKFEVADCIEG